MPWLKGEYKIVCTVCKSDMYRSEAKRNRTGLLGHKNCIDEKLPGFDYPYPQIPQDPRPLEARRVNAPSSDIYLPSSLNGRKWDDIQWTWDAIWLNWDDV